MIPEFVKAWDANKHKLREKYAAEHPGGYGSIVEDVVRLMRDTAEGWAKPDPSRIHRIDDGDYQGTLVFVIAEEGYQPSTYWYVLVGYGSCSWCDTFEGIRDYSSDTPSERQVDDYMTLAMHILQGIHKMGEES